MNRIKKKISAAFLGICMMVFMQAMVCFAADGTLQFSDPTGSVGEEITVKVKMEAGGAPIGDGDVTLKYDTSKLEFVSGTNATGGDGTVTLSAAGTGTETELNYEIVFKALAEGESVIEVTSSTAYLYSDETLNLQHGTGKVTVGKENSAAVMSVSGSETIEISGTVYNVYNDFSDALIPEGFSRATVTSERGSFNGLEQDNSGKQFIYVMQAGGQDPILAYYDKSEGFVLAAQTMLSEDSYIYILGVMDGSKLPETFGETTLDLNGVIFPVWQDSENKDYYLVNAIGPSGEISFYQYDKIDGTYQRYVERETAGTEEEDTPAGNKMIDRMKGFINDNLMIVVAVAAVILFVLILVIIILAVLLGNKKAELEDLYDSYEDKETSRQESKKKRTGKQLKTDEYDDSEYDFDEEDDFDAYDDSEEFDEYDDAEDDFDGYDDSEEEFDEYEDDSEYDSENDDYDIDFIDL